MPAALSFLTSAASRDLARGTGHDGGMRFETIENPLSVMSRRDTAHCCRAMSFSAGAASPFHRGKARETGTLPPAELLAYRRAGDGGTVILVAEDDAAFFQVVRRHFHNDAISRQRLD